MAQNPATGTIASNINEKAFFTTISFKFVERGRRVPAMAVPRAGLLHIKPKTTQVHLAIGAFDRVLLRRQGGSVPA